MTEPSRGVFLSYASEDAQAAARIAEALRAAGIEVWFDRNALRGGDEWDRKIRREIKECALFVPIISANSEARHEGYFRLEWDLADQRSHMIARGRPFLVPVGLDETRAEDAGVPDSFQRVQWTRLPGGATPHEFAESIGRLLAHSRSRMRVANDPDAAAGSAPPSAAARHPRSSSQPPHAASAARRSLKAWGAAGAVALAALVGLGYFALGKRHAPAVAVAVTAPDLAPPTPAPAIASNSIAVLPLSNLSGDPSQQYFSDGLSESLITALAQIPALRVIGKSSSFLFRDSRESSQQIGKQLGVAHLLVGSVERSGDQIRVSAELIDTSNGITVWSQQYDRAYKDLFALQDAITHAVASALKARLLSGAPAATQRDRPPSGSIAAYNALLQGRFYINRSTARSFGKAIAYFTEATRIDPRYALAWAELSHAEADQAAEFLTGAAARATQARARAVALKALALDPHLAYAHVAYGNVLMMDFEWRGAETEFRQALKLAPRNAGVQTFLAGILATMGRIHEAIALERSALKDEPLEANRYIWLADYLAVAHRLNAAEQAIRRGIELQPAAAGFQEQLAVILILRGEARAALEAAQRETSPAFRRVAVALARQIGPDPNAADAALKTLIEKDSGDAPYQIAEVYALRGDASATFRWLDRAWSNHDPGTQTLLYDPIILRFEADPRFAAFCRKAGLPVPGVGYGHTST